VLDIDAARTAMSRRGITPKAIIEGPPRRDCYLVAQREIVADMIELIDRSGI
jgi:uncharacterized glyoxalase superfamily metalloenzyme YdcJ